LAFWRLISAAVDFWLHGNRQDAKDAKRKDGSNFVASFLTILCR
jgi:hypothetical protein